MKIGIYGDSYTTSHGFHDLPTNWFNKLASLMSDIYGPIQINHHGVGGSSLYYTYRKFIDTHHTNDINIVLATGPYRYPYTLELDKPGNSRQFTSKEHVQGTMHELSHILTDNDIIKFNNAINWFDSNTEQYLADVAELMVDRMDTIPNTILYPCFSDSFSEGQFKKHGLDKDIHFMHSLWFRQCELFNIDPSTFTALEKKTLCGHLSMEFNVFFANLLFKKIQTGKWDHRGMLDVTINQPRKFYYENFKDE